MGDLGIIAETAILCRDNLANLLSAAKNRDPDGHDELINIRVVENLQNRFEQWYVPVHSSGQLPRTYLPTLPSNPCLPYASNIFSWHLFRVLFHVVAFRTWSTVFRDHVPMYQANQVDRAGNLGAFQPANSRLSLEHRLRKSAVVRAAIHNLLVDLHESLQIGMEPRMKHFLNLASGLHLTICFSNRHCYGDSRE